MGFIDTTTDDHIPVFYNVVHAVGAGCPNAPDDVKLVQYLLLSLYGKLPPTERPEGAMTVDGSCGPITMKWILKYQLDVNKRTPNALVIDNRIDRVRDHKIKGSISKKYYALLALNEWTLTLNRTAWVATPNLIPLANPMNVPPPSGDMVQPEQNVPESGGA